MRNCTGDARGLPQNSLMLMSRTSFWYRRIWWLPLLCTVAACALVIAAVRTPVQQGGWLDVAILAALPWSLVLLFMEPSPGFAERAGLVVALGLCLNAALCWWVVALVRSRHVSASAHPADGESGAS